MFGLIVALAPSDPWATEKLPKIYIRSSPPFPQSRHKGWSSLSCTLDYMKCKTLWERGKGWGWGALKGNRGKKKSHLQEDPAVSSVPTSETSEYVWKHCECRKRAGLLSAALQCVFNPTAACITEHMFSTQELKQKRLFVIIHSFVYICFPPLFTPSFSNIQSKALVEIATARESEARVPSWDPSIDPRPLTRCSPHSCNHHTRCIYLVLTKCQASEMFYQHELI